MINAATKDVEVSNYEVNQSDQITFSIDTIKYYLKTYPQLVLVFGEDCFYSFDKWKDWKKIIELVKIIVIKRKLDIDDFHRIAKTKKINVYLNRQSVLRLCTCGTVLDCQTPVHLPAPVPS